MRANEIVECADEAGAGGYAAAPSRLARQATYGQIQRYCRSHFGFIPPTCWIADVLADLGLTNRQAPNRKSPSSLRKPCPPGRRLAIVESIARAGAAARGTADPRRQQA